MINNLHVLFSKTHDLNTCLCFFKLHNIYLEEGIDMYAFKNSFKFVRECWLCSVAGKMYSCKLPLSS